MAMLRSCWQTSGLTATARALLALSSEGYAAGRDSVHPEYDHLISVDHDDAATDEVTAVIRSVDPGARPVTLDRPAR